VFGAGIGYICYVDICIARSTEMASVGLPFYNVSLASKSWSNPPRKFADDLRSWVRTLVFAKRQFSDPVIFDKL